MAIVYGRRSSRRSALGKLVSWCLWAAVRCPAEVAGSGQLGPEQVITWKDRVICQLTYEQCQPGGLLKRLREELRQQNIQEHDFEDRGAVTDKDGLVVDTDKAASPEVFPVTVLLKDEWLAPNFSTSWHKLRGPIGTVCVTGDDRIGKSTLLTVWGRKASKSEGFSFSARHGKESHTRGIWSAVLPPDVTGLDYHLNLCDSQGLKQVPRLQKQRLFSANILIPSVLVYMVINVIQNNQLEDLAEYAHQFKQLTSDEFGRFKHTLSPHLLVIVREENEREDYNTWAEGLEGYNISGHLEKVLSGSGRREEKDLVRQVFQSREAWSLPRRVLKDDISKDHWQKSAEAVLGNALEALSGRQHEFPQGGPEFVEWYKSVIDTVNSQEENSMGRLVGLSELISRAYHRRSILEQWRKPVHMALAVLALLLGFGGFLGRSLDRVAWCVWVALCVCYVGTSPFVVAPLQGVIPRLCEQAVEGTSVFFFKPMCTELSSKTVAVVLAALLGVLSYPLLTAQFCWLLEFLPLPSSLHRSGATLLLAVSFAVLGIFSEIDLSASVDADNWVSLGARLFLMLVMGASGTEFTMVSRSNYALKKASAGGRALHFYIAARVQEVQELELSKPWAAHFRSSHAHNALWRYRALPAWFHLPLMLQAASLWVWAYLIRPHCDAALGAGVALNFLFVIWRVGSSAWQRLRRCDPVDSWWASLDDSDREEPENDPATELDQMPDFEPETFEEQCCRNEIEKMRRAQEPQQNSFWAWLRLLCYLSVLCACLVELFRRAGYAQ